MSSDDLVCKGKHCLPRLGDLPVFNEEHYQQDSVNEVCKDQVPESVIVRDHSHPEEKSYCS